MLFAAMIYHWHNNHNESPWLRLSCKSVDCQKGELEGGHEFGDIQSDLLEPIGGVGPPPDLARSEKKLPKFAKNGRSLAAAPEILDAGEY